MIRSYTTKKGEIVNVTQDHLDIALKLKRQLQLESPSHRVNWKRHKKMMEVEGYSDSEASENYRQLIRNYETRVVDDSYEEELEVEGNSKLESIQEAVGDLYYTKREVQLETQKLGKLKRDLTLHGIVAEEIRDAVTKEFEDFTLDFDFTPSETTGDTRMIVTITDWHIGALVDVKGNEYNFEIAKRRIQEFSEKVVRIAKENDVYEIEVVFMGDAVEHSYMRSSQSYDSEFPFSEQVVKCANLIIKTLLYIAKNSFRVSYRGFAGNHDRLNGDKDNNLHGDTAVVLINAIVKTFIENIDISGFNYVDADYYSASLLDVNGRNFKFVHGDKEKKANKGKLQSHSFKDGVIYDAIIMGHYHHFECLEVADDKFEVYIGSIKGNDNYSDDIGVSASISQGVILVYADGEMDFKRIKINA